MRRYLSRYLSNFQIEVLNLDPSLKPCIQPVSIIVHFHRFRFDSCWQPGHDMSGFMIMRVVASHLLWEQSPCTLLVNRTTEKFTINIIIIIITIISIIIITKVFWNLRKVIPVNGVMILVMWIICNEQTEKEGFVTSQYKNCKNQL